MKSYHHSPYQTQTQATIRMSSRCTRKMVRASASSSTLPSTCNSETAHLPVRGYWNVSNGRNALAIPTWSRMMYRKTFLICRQRNEKHTLTSLRDGEQLF